MIDPALLEAHGLALADVAKALSASNTINAVGRLEDHDKLYLALVDNRMAGAADIADTVLQKGASGLVRVRDVATVVLDKVPQWTRVTADGHDAVILEVFQQPDGNTVQIARDVQEKLRQAAPRLPSGIRIANWYDQSRLIIDAAVSVRDSVVIGMFLASGVLL